MKNVSQNNAEQRSSEPEKVHYFWTTSIFNTVDYKSDVDHNYKVDLLTRSMIVNISDNV